MAIIKAKDCLPFFIGKEEIAEKAISNMNGNEAKVLTNFLASIIPVSIYADDSKYADVDNKLAYNPFETQPSSLKNKEGFYSDYRVWRAGRYIGTTQIGSSTIEIKPRFGNGWLEYLLADVFHFRLTKSENERDKSSWNELMRRIFWHLWVNKFTVANQYGLPRRTAKRINQVIQIRGHLNARKSILPFFMKRQVVSEYREKEVDDAICRIIYKAYSILVQRDMRKSAVPSHIQESLNDLYSLYQGHPISISPRDYHDISYKSIYLSWKPLVDFSWQIIQQDSLCKHKNVKGESFSLFLDMAEIWEAFLRKKLGEGLEGWRVWSAEECEQKVYGNTFFGRIIIPDIVLQRVGNDGKDEFLVFDAKYKQMRGNKDDVDRSDFFQIHTYIQYVQHHLGNVILGGLLYPLSVDVDEKRFHSEELFGCNGKDKIPFIVDGIYCSETDDKDSMEKSVEAMINRIKNVLASKKSLTL